MICIFSLVVVVAVTPIRYYEKFLAYTLMIVLLGLISRVSVKYYFARFIILLPLLVFLGVILFVFSEKGWSEKVMIFYNLLAKTLLTFCSFGILVLTVRFQHLIRGMELMRFPKLFTSILNFAYRYIFLFHQEAGRMMKARKSRSFGRKRRWQELKSTISVIPLFLFRLLERSQRIYAAMLSRGYVETMPTFTHLQLTRRDYWFGITFHLLLITAAIF